MGVATYVVNMPDFEKLGLGQNNNVSGTQKIKGQYLSVPAEVGDYEIKWFFDEDIYITDIKYSQSGWKYEDNWDLKIGETLIFETIYTKEIAESEVFHCYCYVAANTEITLVLHNVSGNSRDIWANLHYISKKFVQEPLPEEPEPSPPDQNPEPSNKPDGVHDINHDYDWMIVMRWENNTDVDLDLYAVLESINKEIYFASKEYVKDENNIIWLDQDHVGHWGVDNKNNHRKAEPEVITILGKPCSLVKIFVASYSANYTIGLKEDVTIEIFKKDMNGNKIKAHKFRVEGSILLSSKSNEITNNKANIDFCTIDLNTGAVTKCEGIEDAF